MRRIVTNTKQNTIHVSDVSTNTPVFTYFNGNLRGMVIFVVDKGWVVILGYDTKLTDYHPTLDECIRNAEILGYELFVEDVE